MAPPTSLRARRRVSIADEFATLEQVRAGAYGRASVDIRGDATSVTGQAAELTRVSQRYTGWELPPERIWVDNNISASRFGKKARPEWEAFRSAVAAGELDVVLLTETSRGTRQDFIAFVDLCRDTRTMLCVNGSLYDPGNVDHRLTLGISSQVASAEAERTHARTLRGKSIAAEKGRPSGRPEYGFRRVYDERGALVAVEPHLDQVLIAWEIMTRLVDGERYRDICASLNTRGVPTPSGKPGALWAPQTLKQLVRSPRWIGKRVIGATAHDPNRPYEGEYELVDAMWDMPHPITLDLWEAANARVANKRRIAHRSTALTLLVSVMDCSVCRAPIQGAKMTRYSCRGWPAGDPRGGGHTSILREVADQIVTHAVIARLSDPRIRDLYQQTEEERAATEDARKRLGEIQEKLAALPERVRHRKIDPELAEAQAEVWREEAAELEPLTRPARMPALADRLADPDPVVVAAAWGGLGLHQQRHLLLALTSRISLLPVGRAGRHSVSAPEQSVAIEWAV